MAIGKSRAKYKVKQNDREIYRFDVEKCKICPYKDGCYKDSSPSKTYSVSIKSLAHRKQEEFQNSDYFKERYKERYKIEAKNGEIKCAFGYDKSQTEGLLGMEIQGAMTLFTANIKRIIKLMRTKTQKK